MSVRKQDASVDWKGGQTECISLSDLPTDAIVLVITYFCFASNQIHPARWLGRLSMMNSKFNRIVTSREVSALWSLIPVCLCDTKNCQRCGRQKVPMSFYRKILQNCCLENLDVHITTADGIFRPGSDGRVIADHLLNTSSQSLTTLNIHATVVSREDLSPRFLIHSGIRDTNIIVGDSSESCMSASLNSESFISLRVMLMTIQFPNQNISGQQFKAARHVVNSAIKFYGSFIQEFYLHSSSEFSSDVAHEIQCHLKDEENPLQDLTQFLQILELSGHVSSALFIVNRYLKMTSLKTFRINNPYFWQLNGTVDLDLKQQIAISQFPNLETFIGDAKYEDCDQIIEEMLKKCPNSATHLILIGNTAQFLNNVLCYISIMSPNNLSNLISIRIYDSFFPSVRDGHELEMFSVRDIRKACPNIALLVLPPVHMSQNTMDFLTAEFGSCIRGDFWTFQRD